MCHLKWISERASRQWVCFCWCFIIGISPALATPVKWVNAEGKSFYVKNASEKSKRAAMQIAEAKALSKIIKDSLTSDAIMVNERLGDSGIRSIPFMKIVEKKVIKEDILNREKDLGDLYHVIIEACVKIQFTEKEHGLIVNAALNKVSYKNGDNIQISIRPSQECNVLIINILKDNKIVQIFPNTYKKFRLLKANKPFVFPTKTDMKEGLVLVAHNPEKNKSLTESFLIMAFEPSVTPRAFFPKSTVSDVVDENDLYLSDLMQKIVKIPLEQRAEELLMYQIQ